MSEILQLLINGAYLLAAALFIVGLRRLSRVSTARSGNAIAALGMLIAIVATLVGTTQVGWVWVVSGLLVGSAIGAFAARRAQMTAMPELVALFNGLGGGASLFVALAVFFGYPLGDFPSLRLGDLISWHIVLVLFLSVLIGSVTLTGSVIAWGKLSGRVPGRSVLLPGRHVINLVLALGAVAAGVVSAWVLTDATAIQLAFLGVVALAAVLGVLLVLPIGGADMPVVVSLLNSYSGIAASMTGFVLVTQGEPSAYMLIISGALVGASGIILTNIMCRAMNRSLVSVLLGGFGETGGAPATKGGQDYEFVRSSSAEEAAMQLDGAPLVIVVPGYGLAVSQAQHALAELDGELTARGTTVKYAIHPVAGRMPGHMNVLLAEANVAYEKLFALEEINSEFRNAQVVIVIGANDVVNPAAATDRSSPIYGMPILNAHEAQSVIVIKRSLSPGYAGVKNELFEYPNTTLIFADAKQALLDMLKEVKELRAA
jgi:NAD(P) transhydrogenase subunit beta